MARYKIITLVDITRSNPDRNDLSRLKQGQQSNFNTLLQTVTLRANIFWNRDPAMSTGALPHNIGGKATHWTWEFEIEQEELFKKGDNPIGLLLDDIHGVPIVNQLLNTQDIDPAVFQTRGEHQNIWIEII
jgi:hypothetical protein